MRARPSSTYRVQLHPGFTLKDALGIVPYLADLGISWLYCSPLLMSRPGSEHGYDVVDPTRIDPELGTEADLKRLVLALHERGLGLLLDIVPNHMGVHETNSWWMDVLEQGPASPYARFFDIDWAAGGGKILLPVLGADLPEVLAAHELTVEWDRDRAWLRYYDNRFPLRLPITAGPLAPGPLEAHEGAELLEAQAYRLMRWSAKRPLNYRRFFEINDLVGLRIEDPVVFEAVHGTLFEWIARGWVHGLRIDHPDGLRDPVAYLRALDNAASCALIQAHGSDPAQPEDEKLYIVVEKILTGAEILRSDWPVHGSTGYEQLNRIAGLFVHTPGAEQLVRGYAEFTGQHLAYEEVAYLSKKQVVAERFSVELSRIVMQIQQILHRAAAVPTFSPSQISHAVLEIVANFPVYRSYATQKQDTLDPADREVIERAIRRAEKRSPALPNPLWAFLCSILLLEPPLAHSTEGRAVSCEVLLRLQQLTGPAAAKGVEDTALYRYVPLACQNEVGGEPGPSGQDVAEFHASNEQRARRWPYALTATSTHDTKRSEDVRTRIAALSELPEAWLRAIDSFSALNRRHKTLLNGELAPSASDEYLLYQTLLGIWQPDGTRPSADFGQRLRAYLSKAAREARLNTSWTEPNEAYEAALDTFTQRLLDEPHSEQFLKEFNEFALPIVHAARFSSLSQTLLKIGCPGVPDFYQGSELWDLSLVDPDNRRPVDFETRRMLLAELTSMVAREAPSLGAPLAERLGDGSLKLHVTTCGLHLRKRRERLFASGAYLPLSVEGTSAERVIAFARVLGNEASVFVAGRFFVGLHGNVTGTAWEATRLVLPEGLPRGEYRDVLTQNSHSLRTSSLELSGVFGVLPCAVLERLE